MVDISKIGDFVAALDAEDEKLLENAIARLVKEYGLFVNDEELTVETREAAINKLTANARQIRRSLASGSSVEDAINGALNDGNNDSPAAMLDVPNKDISAEVATYARQQLGNVDTATARERAIVARGILDGSVEIAGSQVKALVDLTQANADKAAAESTAQAEKDRADGMEKAIQAAQRELPTAFSQKEFPGGLGKPKVTVTVYDPTKVSDATKANFKLP